MLHFNSLLVDTLEAENNKYEKTANTQLIVWTDNTNIIPNFYFRLMK